MKRLRQTILVCGLAALTMSSPVRAQTVLESYVARLSADDHFNSSGERLTTVAAILRQDRANVHRFDVRDPEDKLDAFFGDQRNRATLERMIERGRVPPRAARAIIDGTPLVRVTVLRDAVGVFVAIEILEE